MSSGQDWGRVPWGRPSNSKHVGMPLCPAPQGHRLASFPLSLFGPSLLEYERKSVGGILAQDLVWVGKQLKSFHAQDFVLPQPPPKKNHQLKAYTDYQQNISTKSSLWSRNATWKVDHNEQLWAYILFLKFWSFFQQVTELWENGMLQPRFRAGRTDSPWMAKSLQQLGRKVAPVGHWVPTKAKEAEQRW